MRFLYSEIGRPFLYKLYLFYRFFNVICVKKNQYSLRNTAGVVQVITLSQSMEKAELFTNMVIVY